MGIPQEDTQEMTGNVSVAVRDKAWKQKRVFFLTPQVMSNDLSRSLFPADQVKLLVVDEAHRAQGEYAYCLVVSNILLGLWFLTFISYLFFFRSGNWSGQKPCSELYVKHYFYLHYSYSCIGNYFVFLNRLPFLLLLVQIYKM